MIKENLKKYHLEEFSQEKIIERLRARAMKLWGINDTTVEQLDPVVDLLFGACAVEFERIGQAFSSSQTRILERLAQSLVPDEFTGARPAHTIMYCCPEVPDLELKPEDVFEITHAVNAGGVISDKKFFLSPVSKFKLFDATVKCQVSGNKLFYYDKAISRTDSVSIKKTDGLPHNVLWLGLLLNEGIDDLKDMTFYLDWKNLVNTSPFLPLIPHAEVTIDGRVVNVKSGIRNQNQNSNRFKGMDYFEDIEDYVLKIYEQNFLTISESCPAPVRKEIPQEILNIFPSELLDELNDFFVWIKITFPEIIPIQAVSDIYVTCNCFPVINARLHQSNRPYSLHKNFNSIALSMDDFFFCIKNVYSASQQYVRANGIKERELTASNYTLRQSGAKRFDERDATAIIKYLHEVLRDDSVAFSSVNHSGITKEIRILEQSLARIKMNMQHKPIENPNDIQLLLYSKDEDEIWVEFWTTEGDIANGIPSNTKGKLLSDNIVSAESIVTVKTTMGGKSPLTESEKVDALKFSLLSRNRIVTEEDIKSACYAELGSKIGYVEVLKGIKKSTLSKKGFVRIIEVVITPSEDYVNSDWYRICAELQIFLSGRKSFITEIEVVMKEDHSQYGKYI